MATFVIMNLKKKWNFVHVSPEYYKEPSRPSPDVWTGISKKHQQHEVTIKLHLSLQIWLPTIYKKLYELELRWFALSLLRKKLNKIKILNAYFWSTVRRIYLSGTRK